jgi:hypothetical protein
MRKIFFSFLSVCLLYPGRKAAGQVGTHITQGIYKNMVHIATNMLPTKDVFDKATFNQGNIGTNQNETLISRYKTTKNPDESLDLPMDFHSL